MAGALVDVPIGQLQPHAPARALTLASSVVCDVEPHDLYSPTTRVCLTCGKSNLDGRLSVLRVFLIIAVLMIYGQLLA